MKKKKKKKKKKKSLSPAKICSQKTNLHQKRKKIRFRLLLFAEDRHIKKEKDFELEEQTKIKLKK